MLWLGYIQISFKQPTKIHATVDALGNPTAFHLTPGQSHDLQGSDALMETLTKADTVIADKAYDAEARMRNKIRIALL